MTVIVIGANGQLGREVTGFLRERGMEVTGLDHSDVEVADFESVRTVLGDAGPADLVINTAAMHRVPACEEDPQRAFEVNALGARNLARVTGERGWILVHISTDYVYDGVKGKPYSEKDSPRPLNVYGNSKLAGEFFIPSLTDRYYILRVSGIFGVHPCRAKGHNFVELMLHLAEEKEEVRVVDDEILTPTHTLDVARQLERMISARAEFGLYHVSARGSCSWYRFCREIYRIRQVATPLKKADPGEFATGVRRPKYSVLRNAHLQAQGLDIMPHWKEGLRDYLQRIP